MQKNRVLFVWAICMFGFICCNFGDGELKLDDEILIPPSGSNAIPRTSKSTLPEELQWLRQNAQSGNEYVIELTGSGNIKTQNLSFSSARDVTIRLVGKERERIVQLMDNGSMFEIGAGVTLTIGNNVTLKGHNRNNSPLISIAGRGTLVMESGAKISGNTDTRWDGVSGVYAGMDGNFLMKNGEISGMGGSYGYGGVYVADGGYFLMSGGRITNNSASMGGVGVGDGVFMMTGGVISGNTSSGNGGGVRIRNGIFEMEGGSITNNAASGSNNGGGVYVSNATFNMKGGEIYGNRANIGGGVYVESNARIYKTGGMIYGFVMGDNRRNTASAGVQNNDRGHAVYVASSPIKRRETTASSGINLNSDVIGAGGGWE